MLAFLWQIIALALEFPIRFRFLKFRFRFFSEEKFEFFGFFGFFGFYDFFRENTLKPTCIE